MRYWLLTTEFPPFHGGGISTYCDHTTKLFAERGYLITVFFQDENVKNYTVSNPSKNIRIIRFNPDRSKTSAFLGYSVRLPYEFHRITADFAKEEGVPDIIETQDYLGIGYYVLHHKAINQQEWRNTIMLVTLHSPAYLYLRYNRTPLYKFPDAWTCQAEKEAIKLADLLISPTTFLAKIISTDLSIPLKNIHIVKNPFSFLPPEVNKHKKKSIVYFGKLSRQKGSFELLSNFKDLWDQGLDYSLEIIGGLDIVYHPEGLTMGQIVKRKYTKYIQKGLLILKGRITPLEISNKLKDAHIVVVPSLIDNLPYTILESMANGKIVLASIQGGQSEIIEHEKNGFLFDHTIPEDFQKKIRLILELKNDALEKIQKAAVETIANNYAYAKIYFSKKAVIESFNVLKEKIRYPFLYQQPYQPIQTGHETLTIIIPFFNMGKYIRDCVSSVKESTYPHKQILIVDDGSTEENSISALESLSKDDQITIIRKPNEGLAETRNFGARYAQSTYIAFLDADDKVERTYYEKGIQLLTQYENVFFIGCWVRYFGKSSNSWPTFTPQPPYALTHNPINSSSLIYKKQAFLEGGLNDKEVDYGLEDYESIVNMLSNGYNGLVLPEFLFHYRVRSDSMTRKLTTPKLLHSYNYIFTKHSSYISQHTTEVLNIINSNGPGYMYDNPSFEFFLKKKHPKVAHFKRIIIRIVKKNIFIKKLLLAIINRIK